MLKENEVKLLTTGRFLISLADDLDRDEITEVEMNYFLFQSGKYLDFILPALRRFLQREGKLTVHVDAVFTGRPTSTLIGINFNPKNVRNIEAQHIFPETMKMFDELRKLGATIQYSRKPSALAKFFPSWGRDHRKGTVMKDQYGNALVIYTGATNLSGADTAELSNEVSEWVGGRDFTLRITNQDTTRQIAPFFSLHDDNLPSKNIEVTTQLGTYYLSVGNGASLIRKRIISEINAITAGGSVLLASQLTIDPQMARTLRKAGKRGANVELILPNEQHIQMRHPAFLTAHIATRTILGKWCKITYLSKEKWFVHSKAAYISGNGRSIAYSGSENFPVIQGILFHTVDDGIVTDNPELVLMIKEHLESLK
jgi:phosphatidylserine/phosphatidylglycerophosphate/cardiolipin synthase-like enzyme